MFMYMCENWDLIRILSFEIGIWGLDLGFGLGPSDLGIENKRFELFM